MRKAEKNGYKNQNVSLITEAFVHTLIKRRDQGIHKGDCGRVLILAGRKGMAGAAVLCARAALRSGSGLVRVSLPEELFPIMQISVPEATCISRKRSLEDLSTYQAIAAGPGLGDERENEKEIRKILACRDKPVILDADALNLLKDDLSAMKNASARLILTPHPGEAARLLKVSAADINENRVFWARQLAEDTGAVTVLKGASTVVAMPGEKTYINTTGNPGMATAGSGDALTGLIAALAGQGLCEKSAAAAGVYLHGLAGDLAARVWGEYGLLASDIADNIALAIKTTIDSQDILEK